VSGWHLFSPIGQEAISKKMILMNDADFYFAIPGGYTKSYKKKLHEFWGMFIARERLSCEGKKLEL
jgi:hypothetical protein